MTEKHININVPVLSRVEGEGALDIDVVNGKIERLQLKIFEPPRLFEKLLVGRHYSEVPDMVSRICGICPVAYQISAILAFEQLFQTRVSDWIRHMRRVFYCGEWIQSHALHIHLLALPDYFGANSVVELAAQYPEQVRRGLELQALGNQMIKLFGARSINPVGIKVGGFSRSPSQAEVDDVLAKIEALEPAAHQLLEWVCGLAKPDYRQDCLQFALTEHTDYPMMAREIIGNRQQSLSIDHFQDHFVESQLSYSTAFHSLYQQQSYLVGPLARINLNWKCLDQKILDCLDSNNIRFPLPNNYFAIIARAAEIYQALLTAKALLNNYRATKSPYVSVTPRAGDAVGCSEAPRGFLWHRYRVAANGEILSATIVPPTSQNQARIEADIRYSLENFGLEQAAESLQKVAEQVIRNYDPCISCATHFLTLKINRHAQ